MKGSETERTALIAMLQHPPEGVSWPTLAAHVAERGSAITLWEERVESATLFGDSLSAEWLAKAGDDMREWVRQGLTVLTILDEAYPAQLREIEQMPPVLFARGELRPEDHGVSVVGSRNASPSALKFAAIIAARLVESGLTVVSGLAAGIDTAAHTSALAAGGRTVAFIGTGIHKCYPAANQLLQEQIADEGLLMSQFWPDASSRPFHFLMRNAVMSGYGRATVVVEAGETSGTRAQARMAVEHGRPVILTERVATGTNWGAKLRDRPAVYVASTPDEVMSIVHEVTRPLQDRIGNLIPSH